MVSPVVARFHVHVCATCGERVGCTSALCDRRHGVLSHPRHLVPELATIERARAVVVVPATEQQDA